MELKKVGEEEEKNEEKKMRINFLCYLLSVSSLFMEDNFFGFSLRLPHFFLTPFTFFLFIAGNIMQRLYKDFSK